MLAIFSGVPFEKTVSKFRKRKRKSWSCAHVLYETLIGIFTSWWVVQWRQRNVQKSVMHAQSCKCKCERFFIVPDPDLEIRRGRSSRPLDGGGGGGLQTKLFLSFGPQFALKIRGEGPGSPDPSPGSSTSCFMIGLLNHAHRVTQARGTNLSTVPVNQWLEQRLSFFPWPFSTYNVKEPRDLASAFPRLLALSWSKDA